MTVPKNTKMIPLTQGKFALVDADDFDRVSAFRWHAQKTTNGFYAKRNEKNIKTEKGYRQPKQSLANFILRKPRGVVVDHINRNPLDNRKINLRITSQKNNTINRKKRCGCSSKYKGVCFDKESQKWRCLLSLHGKRIDLGRFNNEKDAAVAYDKAAIELFRQFACLNRTLYPKDFKTKETTLCLGCL